MMGQRTPSESPFYYFRIEDYIPEDHLLRLIDRHVDFTFVREQVRRLSQTPEFATARRARNKIEALFSELRNQIRLRGLRNAKEQFTLAATAQNVKRLIKFLTGPKHSVGMALRRPSSQTAARRNLKLSPLPRHGEFFNSIEPLCNAVFHFAVNPMSEK